MMRCTAEQVACAFIHGGTRYWEKEYNNNNEKKRVNPNKTYHRETGPILAVLKLELELIFELILMLTGASAALVRYKDREGNTTEDRSAEEAGHRRGREERGRLEKRHRTPG